MTVMTAAPVVMALSPVKNQARTGDRVDAINADNEEILLSLYTDSQIAINAKPSHQLKPNSTPTDVATPLPPLKPKNTGNRWPKKAAKPTKA